MATSQAAYAVEKAVGHGEDAIIEQDVANYNTKGDPSGTMKALVWMGKQKVEMGASVLSLSMLLLSVNSAATVLGVSGSPRGGTGDMY
jgi:hypothetical protein